MRAKFSLIKQKMTHPNLCARIIEYSTA